MAKYSFKKPSLKDVLYIAKHLRADNKEELMAAVGDNACFDIKSAYERSSLIGCFYVDDEPVVLYGVRSTGFMSDTGVVWLLTTEKSMEHSRVIARYTRAGLAEMLRKYRRLYNYTNVGNKRIVHWLRWLGADFKGPVSYGVYGLEHWYFEFRRRDEDV